MQKLNSLSLHVHLKILIPMCDICWDRISGQTWLDSGPRYARRLGYITKVFQHPTGRAGRLGRQARAKLRTSRGQEGNLDPVIEPQFGREINKDLLLFYLFRFLTICFADILIWGCGYPPQQSLFLCWCSAGSRGEKATNINSDSADSSKLSIF